MKSRKNPVFGFLLAFAVMFSLVVPGAMPALAQNLKDSIPHPALEKQGAVLAQQGNPAAQQFDGKQLYKSAFELLRDYHIKLADDNVRKQWVAEWEHKFDGTGKLASEQGADEAIREMVKSLGQRFDGYMDVQQVKDDQQRSDASLVGIGISIKLHNQEDLIKSLPANPTRQQVEDALKVDGSHPLTVEEPFEGGPAEKAGIRSGDRIVKVDGQSIDGLTLNQVVGKIRGKENTTVTVTVERTDSTGKTSEHSFTITRATVVVKVVKHQDLGNGVHYVKLKDFVSQYAVQEFVDALNKAKGGRALIIDLRDNGGGRLDYVMYMTGLLLPEGTALVTHNRNGDQLIERRVTYLHDFALTEQPDAQNPARKNLSIGDRPDLIIPADMPLVVLVNERSASASEILSGVLKHHHRATLVGKTTLGKGVGQTVVPLPFGRKLRITSFEFLPGGAAMDWIGIVPDVEVDQPADSQDDKQLEAARKTADELASAREAREAKRAEQKRQNEEKFKQSRQD